MHTLYSVLDTLGNTLNVAPNSDQTSYVSFPRHLCSYHHGRFLTLQIECYQRDMELLVRLSFSFYSSNTANVANSVPYYDDDALCYQR